MTRTLVSVDDLAARLGDASLRIADCRWYLDEPERGAAAYREAHVPGAVYVDLERDLSATDGPGRHPLPAREEFARRMGDLGIGDDHLVVAYDDRGGAVAARLWWMLRDVGHPAVAVLDGGLPAWEAAGYPVTDEVPDPPPATLSVRPGPTRTVDRAAVRASLGSLRLLDARAAERYRGEAEPIDPVAGHIPTAHSVPLTGNLDERAHFLSPRMLAERYAPHEGHDVAVYCGSGVTACHDILAMVHAGLDEPALYPGSWSDWSTAGLPVATGDDA
ncbi:MAG: sulfurtransferase [Acidimicrobiia bacterium]|nr:sulfurtransferase [Acidimicrobiia bacterium]